MLKLEQVTKAYFGNGTVALRDVELELPRGEIIGLFGENGAGKTTLMKCILGFHRHEGRISLDGAPISHRNIAAISFATSEHSFFPALSAEAHADFFHEHFPNFRRKRFEALMRFFELPPHRALRSFSTGQKNQFEVILALSQGADYILMDEPFAGNDMLNREDFYKVLLGILEPTETVLLSTHLIEEVERFIGRCVLIRKGRIVGDRRMDELEDEGVSLLSYVKETYGYEPDRVSRALAELTGGENGAER